MRGWLREKISEKTAEWKADQAEKKELKRTEKEVYKKELSKARRKHAKSRAAKAARKRARKEYGTKRGGFFGSAGKFMEGISRADESMGGVAGLGPKSSHRKRRKKDPFDIF